MKQFLNNLWLKISENGITSVLNEAEKKRIRILNRIILLVIFVSLFLFVVDLIVGVYIMIPVIVFSIIVCLFIFFLLYNKKYSLAKLTSILFFIIYVTISSIITGKNSGTDIFMIPVVLLPTILFKEKKIILLFTLITISIFSCLYWYNYNNKSIIHISEELLSFYLFIGTFSSMIICFFVIWYFRNINQEYENIILEKNERLVDSNKQINLQKIKIEIKNKEVTDSINYASRIQKAILPNKTKINDLLPNNFILYKPKDIVAGDFYWIEKIDACLIIAAGDCTGHGVPGAMVSVVCHNALNRAVKEFNKTEPDKILNKTKELVIESLEQGEEEVYDGMDIALCSLDLSSNLLQYSGANNPLFLIRNKELHITSADRQPIGKYLNSKPFTNNKINLLKGDSIYIFTDGYADQFGGPKGKKLKLKKFKELLINNVEQPMSEQKKIIESAFENWKGDMEQIDDVCVIGIKI